ncbi:hypothetical protein BC829DRAFT_493644 [Chytridium lagenaria]|nr:hypothetical protein BC829DRAFT_493644 [Chytridium lagenaria]
MTDAKKEADVVQVVEGTATQKPSSSPSSSSPFDFTADDLVEFWIPSRTLSSLPTWVVSMPSSRVSRSIQKSVSSLPARLLNQRIPKHKPMAISLAAREAAFGPNVLPAVADKSLFYFILRAFQDKILILLTVAAFVALGVGLYIDFRETPPDKPKTHWIEGVAIIVAVKEDRKVKTLRDGKTQMVSIYSVLVGDILLLEPGDIIGADGVYISGMGLRCDESAATGETDAIKKGEDSDPFLLSGSKVNEGIGKYVVTAVGVHSFHGKTMMALRTEDEDTPLQVKLDGLAERIAKLGSAAAIIMFVVLLMKYLIVVFRGNGFGESRPEQESGSEIISQIIKIVIGAITVIVVAVPEGLPLAVTLALAFATTRTLTQNKMTVVTGVIGKNVLFQDDDEIKALEERLGVPPFIWGWFHFPQRSPPPPRSDGSKMDGPSASVLFDRVMEGVASTPPPFESVDETGEISLIGSKTETALLEWCQTAGRDWKQIRTATPERKRMSTIVKIQRPGEAPVYRVHVKGASEIVLQDCDRAILLPFSSSPNAIASNEKNPHASGRKPISAIPTPGSRSNPTAPIVYPVDQKLIEDYNEIINRFAEATLRTICIAYRDFTEDEFQAVLKGPIRDNYLLTKKQDRDQTATKDNILTDPIQAAPLTPSTPPNSTLPTDRLGVGSSGYAASDVQSFATTTTDDEEPTDADLLAHTSALGSLHLQGVPEAVEACKGAGVFVRMVTGDNVLTARSIAERCGIHTKGGLVMEGTVFRRMTDEQRKAILPGLQVLARSSPTDKQLLVQGLKELGETVAVTGDGTNDGPALKLADIGFSMGIAGTEVAKEASSIILMDDSFSSVVSAIMWGRSVNDSVRKFLQFQLSVNVSAVAITFISAISDSSESSVLTAVQLLWVNLIMDSLAALALATERPTPELLNRPPTSKKAKLISITMWKMIFGQSILQVGVNLTLLFAGPNFFNFTELIAAGGMMGADDKKINAQAKLEKELIRTIVFNSFVMMQIFNMINCRRIDNKLNVFKRLFQNPYFYSIFLGVAIVQFFVVQYGDIVFSTTDLNVQQWVICCLIGLLSIPWGTVVRLIPDEVFESCFGRLFVSDPTPSQVALQDIYFDGNAPAGVVVAVGEVKEGKMRRRMKKIRESFFSKVRGSSRRENADS